jgi:hypothetical protein
VPLQGERINPSPCVTVIFGSLKKNRQKTAKTTKTDPKAIQLILIGIEDMHPETIKRASPAAREGKIKGKPSFKIDILPSRECYLIVMSFSIVLWNYSELWLSNRSQFIQYKKY